MCQPIARSDHLHSLLVNVAILISRSLQLQTAWCCTHWQLKHAMKARWCPSSEDFSPTCIDKRFLLMVQYYTIPSKSTWTLFQVASYDIRLPFELDRISQSLRNHAHTTFNNSQPMVNWTGWWALGSLLSVLPLIMTDNKLGETDPWPEDLQQPQNNFTRHLLLQLLPPAKFKPQTIPKSTDFSTSISRSIFLKWIFGLPSSPHYLRMTPSALKLCPHLIQMATLTKALASDTSAFICTTTFTFIQLFNHMMLHSKIL